MSEEEIKVCPERRDKFMDITSAESWTESVRNSICVVEQDERRNEQEEECRRW